MTAPRGWGFWTEAKLDILSAYLPAFATASKRASELVYLDLFAGNASNQRRDVERDIKGSAIRALESLPARARVHLFELEPVAADLERELRHRFPDRSFDIVAGDCNATLSRVLDRLAGAGVDWAPTFAFVDPYSSAGLRWGTVKRLADFKRNRPYKVEQWLLFYGSDIPRVLGQSADNASLLRRTFGSDDWLPIADGRKSGDLTADDARYEYRNLLRWRLERVLGYKYTHAFEMKNTSGAYLYDLVFATDNDAGNRIMRDVYAKAVARFEGMRAEAFERRRAAQSGTASLFGVEAMAALSARDVPRYEPAPPTLPYGMPSPG